MKKFILTIVAVLFHLLSFGQMSAYSFEGTLSIEQKEALEMRCMNLDGIRSVKCRYKEDQLSGELVFDLAKTSEKRGEADQTSFSPADIKAILLEFQLTPLDYHPLNR